MILLKSLLVNTKYTYFSGSMGFELFSCKYLDTYLIFWTSMPISKLLDFYIVLYVLWNHDVDMYF